MNCARSKLKKIVLIVLIAVFIMSMSYNDNKTVYNSNAKSQNKIALTFDDGPHPKITPKVLDLLKKYDIKATFFAIGVNVDNYSESLKRAANEGHEIGNHTNSHSILKSMDKDKIAEEIRECEEKIMNLTGIKTMVLRPPCGIYDETLVKIANQMNYKIILWNIDTHDWAHMTTKEIVKTVSSNIKGGDIILCHDYISGENHTIEALEVLIPMLLKNGYEFVTVSQLLQD